MPAPLVIKISSDERAALEQVRDHHPKAYMRERAAAILKIVDGASGLQVAHHGLLKKRDCDSIYEWVKRYRQEGIAGLKIRPGRGRKPAFSP